MEKRLTQEEIDDLIKWVAKILQEKDDPVVKGEWKDGKDEFDDDNPQCSNCGAFGLVKTNFCPNCGADMREEINDD